MKRRRIIGLTTFVALSLLLFVTWLLFGIESLPYDFMEGATLTNEKFSDSSRNDYSRTYELKGVTFEDVVAKAKSELNSKDGWRATYDRNQEANVDFMVIKRESTEIIIIGYESSVNGVDIGITEPATFKDRVTSLRKGEGW